MKKRFIAIVLSVLFIANVTAYGSSDTTSAATQTAAEDTIDSVSEDEDALEPISEDEETIEPMAVDEDAIEPMAEDTPYSETNTTSKESLEKSDSKSARNRQPLEKPEIESLRSSRPLKKSKERPFSSDRYSKRYDNKSDTKAKNDKTTTSEETASLIDTLLSGYSAKSFKAEAVPDDMIQSILLSGQKAPSAMNLQPWYFTVIRNSDIAADLVSRDYQEGCVVIVVSGKPNERTGINVAFDSALATQNMYIAAQSLGLGAHLYYGGVQEINDNMKDTLGIPDEYEAQIIMLIGYIDNDSDTVSSASIRNPVSDNTFYID